MKITITGPRAMPPAAADRCDVLFERYMATFVRDGHEFFVGGAVGIDTLAPDWLVPDEAPSRSSSWPPWRTSRPRHMMVDRSALVIGFSGTGSSSEDTWYTLEHAASKGHATPHRPTLTRRRCDAYTSSVAA